jgi:radical SAM protein with 4Fe4S-binding SPASM domain
VDSIPFGVFAAQVQQGASARRIPLYGMIELTRRCPLRCAHCYNNLPLGDTEAAARELTTDEHCRIVDEIAPAGCLHLTYTGGEIFARPDFLEIYDHAKRAGLLVTLFTNGTMVTPAIADHLAVWRPFEIEITLYGRTRETHERVTGVPGSFDRTLEAVRLLAERKLPLALKTMALTVNEHEVLALRDFVEEGLGLSFRFDPMINPRIDASPGPLTLRLSPCRALELDLADPSQTAAWRKRAHDRESWDPGPGASSELYRCGAGITGFGIDAYGGLNGCLFSPAGKFDLRAGRFAAGWEGPVRAERARTSSRRTRCTACGIRDLCGMCPPNSELEEGDPDEPVAFYCDLAHLRAGALGVPVQPHGDCEHCGVARSRA